MSNDAVGMALKKKCTFLLSFVMAATNRPVKTLMHTHARIRGPSRNRSVMAATNRLVSAKDVSYNSECHAKM